MNAPPSFQSVFSELKGILQSYEDALRIVEDTNDNYVLNTPYTEQYGKELFFGAAQIKKNYVSYHLMPVYMYTDLLDELPEHLEQRMHGKSCFNFTSLSDAEFDDLSRLTRKGFERMQTEGLLQDAT